jgi:hypothetical protein
MPNADAVIDLAFSPDPDTETITVRYQNTDPLPPGEVTFSLVKAGTVTICAETTDTFAAAYERAGVVDVMPAGFEDIFHWDFQETFRRDLPCEGLYYLRAEHENGAWGISDTFFIDCPGEGGVVSGDVEEDRGEGGFEGFVDVEVVYPNGGEHLWDEGSPWPIRWRIVGQYDRAPATWTIEYIQTRDDENRRPISGDECRKVLEKSCEDYEDHYGGAYPYRECRVMPTHIEWGYGPPRGSYRIRISGTDLSGVELSDESDAEFGLGPSVQWTETHVVVSSSRYGENKNFRIGGVIYFFFRPMDLATIHLMRGDEILDTTEEYRRVTSYGAYMRHYRQGSFPTDSLDEGDGYKVRVINNRNSADWEDSETFSIRESD